MPILNYVASVDCCCEHASGLLLVCAESWMKTRDKNGPRGIELEGMVWNFCLAAKN